MNYSLLLMSLLLLGLASCNSSDGGGGSKPAQNEQIDSENQPRDGLPTDLDLTPEAEMSTLKVTKKRKVQLEKDFSNFQEFKQNINNYEITLHAESGDYVGAGVECTKNLYDRNKTTFTSKFDEKGLRAKVSLTMESTDPMIVEYDCKVIDREIEMASAKIKLKKSFIVTGTQNVISLGVAGASSIESLVLDEGSVLVTDGAMVNLTMNELISNKGSIVTFAKENMPLPLDNESGKSGGIINIVTEKGIGDISFELRGGAAGKQTNTQSPRTEIPATDPALDGGSNCRPGKQGHQGHKGHKGHPGFNGGDTGILLFRSFGENTLKMNVSYFPGLPGVGGVGGLGGTGGAGGKSGFFNAQGAGGSCKNPGKQGPVGVVGDSGDSGLAGKTQRSSVIYTNEDIRSEFEMNWNN